MRGWCRVGIAICYAYTSPQISERGARPSASEERPTSLLETRALRRVSRLEPGEVEHRRSNRRALQTDIHSAGCVE